MIETLSWIVILSRGSVGCPEMKREVDHAWNVIRVVESIQTFHTRWKVPVNAHFEYRVRPSNLAPCGVGQAVIAAVESHHRLAGCTRQPVIVACDNCRCHSWTQILWADGHKDLSIISLLQTFQMLVSSTSVLSRLSRVDETPAGRCKGQSFLSSG
jgi:hypothetical protein